MWTKILNLEHRNNISTWKDLILERFDRLNRTNLIDLCLSLSRPRDTGCGSGLRLAALPYLQHFNANVINPDQSNQNNTVSFHSIGHADWHSGLYIGTNSSTLTTQIASIESCTQRVTTTGFWIMVFTWTHPSQRPSPFSNPRWPNLLLLWLSRLERSRLLAFSLLSLPFDLFHVSDDIRNKLHWLPIRQRISFKLCLLVFRCLRGEAPNIPLGDALSCIRTVMPCDRIVRRLVVISSYREHLTKTFGPRWVMRSLDRLHGTHSHHPWKTKDLSFH